MKKLRHLLLFLTLSACLLIGTILCAAAAGEYEVRNGSGVQVGTYDTLSSAVSAVAGDNYTVNVLADVTETTGVTLNKNKIYTINGNGHTISTNITGNMLTISSGNVTLDNVTLTGGGIQIYMNGNARLTVQGASNLGGGCSTRIMHLSNASRGGTVTIQAGTFTAADVAEGGIKASGAKLVVNGGTFYGSSKASIIALSDGDFVSPVDISGGTFNMPASYLDVNNNNKMSETCVLQYTGRGDLGSDYSARNGVVVSITGGTFNADAGAYSILYATRTSTNDKGSNGCLGSARPVVAISGGTFSGSHAWLRSYADVEFRISGTPTFTNAATDDASTRGIWLHNASKVGRLEISGGTFITTGNAYLIHGAGAAIAISGGAFTHTGHGINMSDGDCVSEVTVTGGTFTNVGAGSTINFTAYNKFANTEHKGFVEISGGTFNVNGAGPVLTYTSTQLGTHCSITGGTFIDSDGENLIVAGNGVDSPLCITGGTFIDNGARSITPAGAVEPTDGVDNDFARSFTRFVPGRGGSGICVNTTNGVTGYAVDSSQFSPFCGMQLVAKQGLIVHFYILLPTNQTDPVVQASRGGTPTALFASDCVCYPDGTPIDPGYTLRRYTYEGIQPAEMGNAVQVTLTVGGVTTAKTYTLREYGASLLASNSLNAQAKALIANLLHYGAAAQLFSNPNIDPANLVNATPGVSTYATAFQPLSGYAVTHEGIGMNGFDLFDPCIERSTVNRLGIHMSAPVLDAVRITYSIEGRGACHGVPIDLGNGNYAIYADALELTDFGKTVVFTMHDNDATDGINVAPVTWSFSVLSLIESNQEDVTAKGNLARAFGAYYQAARKYFDPFAPVLRFVAISDIHFMTTPHEGQDMPTQAHDITQYSKRLNGLFQHSYAYAAEQSYNVIDAFMIVGDNTDDGTVKQITDFLAIVRQNIDSAESKLLIVNGNHEFYDTGNSNYQHNDHDATDTRLITELKESDITNYSALQFHTVIGGYHFIGFSPTNNGGRAFSDEVAAWLRGELALAAADDPTGVKPIFVCQHQQVHSTVNGSPGIDSTYSQDNIRRVLADYPQVVDFAGHSHSVLDDPGSIWQGEFTALSTGTLSATGLSPFDGEGGTTHSTGVHPTNEVGGTHNSVHGDKYNEHSEKETAEYTIVELDANNRMRVRYFYLITEENGTSAVPLGERIIHVGDPAEFNWTGDQSLSYLAPRFTDGQALELYSSTATTLRFRIPQAVCNAGIRSYRCELYEGAVNTLAPDAAPLQVVTRLSGQFRRPVPDYVLAPFRDLQPNTTYTVKVYPVSNVHTVGHCLTLTATTPAAPIADGVYQPDVLQVRFTENGSAVDTVTGETLVGTGTAATAFDAALGRHVGVFNGQSDYQWRGMKDAYELLQSSMTFEVYAKVTQKVPVNPNSDIINYVDLVSNQQHGGIGFELKANNVAGEAGDLYFYFCINNKDHWNQRVGPYSLLLNEYVHLVGTYDGKYARFYVNGELIGELACPASTNGSTEPSEWTAGLIDFPLKTTSQYLSIGGDSGLDYQSQCLMTGSIAAVNLYSTALPAEQIALLAKQYPQKVLQVQFNADGTAVNAVTNTTLTVHGSPTASYDPTIGRTVGVFNGNGDYQWRELSGAYDKLQNGFSLETYLKVDQRVTTDWMDLVSNQESGGFGFELKPSTNPLIAGDLYFLFYCGTLPYNRVGPYAMPLGEYVHLVVTDTGTTCTLYANGALIHSATHNSSITFPSAATARYLSIGGDSAINYNSSGLMTGSIAAVNLYTSALTASQVAALNVYQRALLRVQFHANGTAVNAVTNTALTAHGSPTTAVDPTVGRTVGVFNGNGDYQWRDMAGFYSALATSLTLETYVKVDAGVETDWVDLISNQHAGGIGFELKPGNRLYFLFSCNGATYNRVGPYIMPLGEYVHLVVTYDGSNCILYANGAEIARTACSDPIVFPTEPATVQYLSIGGDASTGYQSNAYMTGSIATVSLYDEVLTAGQVAILYHNRNN